MIRLAILTILIAFIADHFGLLPVELSNLLDNLSAESKVYFEKSMKAIEEYAIHLALTFIGLVLINLMDVI